MNTEGTTLQGLCDKGRTITYGVIKPGLESPGGVTFIRGGDIHGGKIDEANLRTIEPKVSERYRRTILQGGELLVSLVGNPGEVAVAPTRLAGANIARQVGIVPLASDTNPQFVMYFLRSHRGRSQLFTRTQGAVQQVINLADLKTVQIPAWPRSAQDQVASILASYDDLMENNRRRIQLLEESARLLYREWFVHLRFPGHEHVRIVDGVPEGWQRKPISEVADTLGGGTPSTKNSQFWENGDIVWFTPSDLTGNDCLALVDSEKKITGEGLQGSSAKLLPPRTVLMSSRASIGFFGMYDGQAATNQGFIAIVPHDGERRMFLLHHLMARVGEIVGLAGGTTYREINKSTFRAFNVLVPSSALCKEFEEYSTAIFDQVLTLKKMNRKLAQARDLLLPRLMSGEIAV